MAGFIAIDRFLQSKAPICCLPFDCIGVRHPGTGASTGSLTGLKYAGNPVSRLVFGPQGPHLLTMIAEVVALSFALYQLDSKSPTPPPIRVLSKYTRWADVSDFMPGSNTLLMRGPDEELYRG